MHRKLVAISLALALALVGVGGTAVAADEGTGPITDYDVDQEISPDPLDDEFAECSISTNNDEFVDDGGSGGGGC